MPTSALVTKRLLRLLSRLWRLSSADGDMGNCESLPADKVLDQVCLAWPGAVWTWDGRHSCVVCSFSVSAKEEHRAVVREFFPDQWDSAGLKEAPPAFQELVGLSGGLRDGQLAFSPNPLSENHGYALWWPWGDGNTISVRIGIANADAEALAMLRAKVGIKG